jgi:tRNA threonylcarbamoyladenosine biosynthesis protein TsaB
MGLLLHIDTAGEIGSIAVSNNEQLLGQKTNTQQLDHASWIHTAIAQLLHEVNYSLQQLEAISVTIGPGSYTGLRVGLSTAKGLCYALQKPLIAIPTLELMASVVACDPQEWIAPLIDARRMEVYTAIYDANLQVVQSAQAMVLDAQSFSASLSSQKIVFTGNGMEKFKKLCVASTARFVETQALASAMIPLALRRFTQKDFADVVYTEPLYVKAFYTVPKS